MSISQKKYSSATQILQLLFRLKFNTLTSE